MKPNTTSPSATKVILAWLMFLVVMAAIFGLWIWGAGREAAAERVDNDMEASSRAVFSVVMAVMGIVFFIAGVAGYVVTIFTNCLTFNFNRRVWADLKVKIYFANIFVPLGVALGIGFLLCALLGPSLLAAGLDPTMANLLPLFGVIFILQVAQVWILIWGPLEKRVIQKRTAALGITPEQLQSAFLVGLSNPVKSSFKKFSLVEEDVGALWVGPEQLIYWGDVEQTSFTRDQIVEIERRADSGSTSMLAGIAHVILHVQQADGSIRQIRLHNEGLLTMGQKRKAMNDLANAILHWHNCETVVPPVPQL